MDEEEDLIENLFGFEDLEDSSEDENSVVNNRLYNEVKITSAATNANKTNENQEQQPKPKRIIRRNIPKFDSSTLLSENGLVKLQTLISKTNFKKGRGHECENLNRLIGVYQLWGHNLYPRYKFKSIIERTEKICSEKRLKIAYLAWKESNKYMNINKENINKDNGMINDEDYMINEDNELYNEEIMNTNNNNNFNNNYSNNNNIDNTNTINNVNISHNNNNENANTQSIPISRLPHPLTDEERAFIIANKERALKKLREKKKAMEMKKKLKEMENNVASTSTSTTSVVI